MTLTEFANQMRTAAKFALLVILIFGSLVFVTFIVILGLQRNSPTVANLNLKPSFGKITSPLFELASTSLTAKYVLDTIDGELPQTTASANVYYIPENKATLAYLRFKQTLAEGYKFNAQITDVPLNNSWTRFEDENKVLDVDTKNQHYKFKYKSGEMLQDLVEATPEAKFTLLEDYFLNAAKNELQRNNSYPTHLAAGKTNIVYVAYDLSRQEFVPVDNGQMPQAVRVDFFRKEDDLTIVSPNYFGSQNYVVLAPLGKFPEVVEAQFTSFEKLETEPGVYPLISSKTAWEKLKKGEAQTISISDSTIKEVHVKDIFLAYYDPSEYQEYFQPIYVFLGDNNYVGYLPAVDNNYPAQ